MPDELALSEAETKEFELMRAADSGEPEPDPAPQPDPAPTPQPDPQPTPDAPKAADAPKPGDKDKPTRLVPIDALHEERTKRKALEQRIAELSKPAPTPAPSDDIDETQDPIGAIAKLKAELKAEREAKEEAKRIEGQLQEVAERVGARVTAYAAEHPEYPDQVRFLRQSRAGELKALKRTDAQILHILQQEEMTIGIEALQNDWDPGEMIAELAKVRGWKAKDHEPQPTPTPTPAPNPAAEARLDRLERGQKASISSSDGGGGGPEPEMTLERLMSLNGEAFNKAWEKHAKRLMA